ncbi:MAG: VOC family protein [Rhodobacterales bacterium]|nr:VOC family protein [Rhodobacterales bacterium]
MLRLDHLAISAERLDDGVAAVEAALGISMSGGGKHPLMATHNRLLGLGDLYLEVIAIDPDTPPPPRRRWFDLDHFSGPPRLTNWVVGCDDMPKTLAAGPPGWGKTMALARGDYRWQMAVPDDGRLPFDGIFPALIRWEGALHPANALPETGLRLQRLEIRHPDARAIRTALAGLDDARVTFVDGPAPAISAWIDTPVGPRLLA